MLQPAGNKGIFMKPEFLRLTCLPAVCQAGNTGMSKIPSLAGVEYWNVDLKKKFIIC